MEVRPRLVSVFGFESGVRVVDALGVYEDLARLTVLPSRLLDRAVGHARQRRIARVMVLLVRVVQRRVVTAN